MSTPRDSQKSKVRSAISACAAHFDDLNYLDRAKAEKLNERLVKAFQKMERFDATAARDVLRRHSSSWADQWWHIAMAVQYALPYGEPMHGREFARAYLKMVQRFIGKEKADYLREQYKEHGVKYRAAPKLSDEERARRRAQGQRLQAKKAEGLVEEHRARILRGIESGDLYRR